MSKKLKSFQVAVGEGGRELRITVRFEDGTSEDIDFDAALAPRLVQLVIQGAAAAEKLQKAAPGSAVSVGTPWRARDVRAGTVLSGDLIAVGFATDEGPPVDVILPRNIAEKTVRSILDELKRASQKQ
jgi:hypothetical protein